MELLYKTRGNASAQGKPRVYFCSHPKDRMFLDEICADILKTQNCAVFYKDEPFSLASEDDLKQTQLFVMPVTARLLAEESVAKQEFAIAQKEHIPVLPLMQESGLEGAFNAAFGDLQYLYKYSGDITAISFEEKLAKFLDSVLIGDELAEKVRAEFDAYIFLSYRKKDRKHAQELIRLIHQNEFCWDIAVWYDEFLTPGENFNEEIESALKKSELFVLAVTPNLVNEENYVAAIEYPMARAAGKRVLSAELLPTDRVALNEKFEGLDEPTDAYDKRALSDALFAAVQALALKGNDRSPEHNFFIGLAYLTGIDVEVDKERALRLITESAETGLPEAIKKLADIYHNGEGVARDLSKAITWQERLTEVLENAYNAITAPNEYEAAAAPLVGELTVLGRWRREAMDWTAARKAFLRALKIAHERLKKGKAKTYFVTDYAAVCLDIGESFFGEKDFSNARRYYKYAYDMLESLLRQGCKEKEVTYAFAVCCERFGTCAFMEGDFDASKAYTERFLEMSEAQARQARTETNLYNLSVARMRAGMTSFALGETEKAEAEYSAGIQTVEELLSQKENAAYHRTLAMLYEKLGECYALREEHEQAETLYRKALESISLANEYGEDSFTSAIYATIYHNLGKIYKAMKKNAEAKAYFEKFLRLEAVVKKAAGIVEDSWLAEKSECYELLAEIAEEAGDFSEAEAYYRKALAIDEGFAAGGGAEAWAARNSVACGYFNIYRVSADGASGRACLKKAYELWEEMLQESPQDDCVRDNMFLAQAELEKTEK